MEIKQLQTFVTLARLQNFTKTAEELNYAQSNISSHIQKLEEEFGCRLFDRMGHKVALNDKGQMLLPYANQILTLGNEATQKLSARGIGKIALGISESLCSDYVLSKLKDFRELYPQLELTVSIIDTNEYVSVLESGALDIVYILDHTTEHPSLRSIQNKEETIVFFASSTHPFTSHQRTDLADIAAQNLVVTSKGCCYRAALEKEFQKQNLQFHPMMATSSIQILKKTVKNNLGIGFLPITAIEEELGNGEFKTIAYPVDFQIYSQLLLHKDKWIGEELQKLVSLLT